MFKQNKKSTPLSKAARSGRNLALWRNTERWWEDCGCCRLPLRTETDNIGFCRNRSQCLWTRSGFQPRLWLLPPSQRKHRGQRGERVMRPTSLLVNTGGRIWRNGEGLPKWSLGIICGFHYSFSAWPLKEWKNESWFYSFTTMCESNLCLALVSPCRASK